MVSHSPESNTELEEHFEDFSAVSSGFNGLFLVCNCQVKPHQT